MEGIEAPVQVACFVTQANRAAPVFDLDLDDQCLRLVDQVVDRTERILTEWKFDTLFPSAADLDADLFFERVTAPAVENAVRGINSNVIACGVHPTQKFRLLFGKSTGSAEAIRQKLDLETMFDLFGQCGRVLQEVFGMVPDGNLQLGLSSWIVVNNTVKDLFYSSKASQQDTGVTRNPFTFTTLHADSLSTAMSILQLAKTNRIIQKGTADHAHFFFRLSVFHHGQISMLHLVDVVDAKEFQEPISIQEKDELYNLFLNMNAGSSLSHHATSDTDKVNGPLAPPSSVHDCTMLSKFLRPLLTMNFQNFVFVNVVDYRPSLNESKQLLDALVAVRGYVCKCHIRGGLSFADLGFETPTFDILCRPSTAPGSMTESNPRAEHEAPCKRSFQLPTQHSTSDLHGSVKEMSKSEISPSSTMSWLESYSQRRNSILGGSPPTDAVRRCMPTEMAPNDTLAAIEESLFIPCTQEGELLDGAHLLAGGNKDDGHEDHSLWDRNELLRLIHQAAIESPTEDAASSRKQYCTNYLEDKEVSDNSDSSSWGMASPPPGQAIDHQGPLVSSNGGLGNDQGPESAPVDDNEQPPPAPPYSPSKELTRTRRDVKSALYEANIPSKVPAPPDVSGLDAETAAKVKAQEANLLRKNYQTLLSVVQDQQRQQEDAEERAVEAERAMEEGRTRYELQMEDFKLSYLRLRQKLRALQHQSAVPSKIFEQYEQEIKTLQSGLNAARSRNVALELQLAEPSASSRGSGSAELRKKYQAAIEERNAMEKQLADYRRRERHFQVNSKVASESTKRLEKVSRELAGKEKELVTTRLQTQRLVAEYQTLEDQIRQLNEENESLAAEKNEYAAQLESCRAHIASIDKKRDKSEMLATFMKKHGQQLKKPTIKEDDEYYEDNVKQRDLQTVANEVRTGVKRSAPHLVPATIQLVQRLETQALALQEHEEREADFIRLLVELASDQPARSLRNMIAEELQKLS